MVCARRELEMSAFKRHVHAGRYDVDVVGGDRHAVGDLGDAHRRLGGEEMAQEARMLSIEMLHKDERHSGVFGQLLKKSRERLKTACRCTDANHDARMQVCFELQVL